MNLAAMALLPDWETVPFHFIWVSLTVLYGFRVWKTRPTLAVLAFVMASTGFFIALEYRHGYQPLDELTEVPLMAAMFIAMVWHARRRLTAMEETERVSMENLKLLERERQFVQDASHELRTPITVALGHSELIQRRATDATVVEDAEVIADELLRLRRLVNGLLLLAGTGDPNQLHREPVDVGELAADAVHRWAAQPRRWSFDGADDAIIVGDADRLAVALDALIENAVQYTQEGDLIEIHVRRRADRVEITVRDTGQGIEPQDLDKVFDRFARADPSRSRHTGGFGLGLSIVRAIVEAHGGTVAAESRSGEGSTFRIELPAAADHGRTPGSVLTLPEGDEATSAPEGVSWACRSIRPSSRSGGALVGYLVADDRVRRRVGHAPRPHARRAFLAGIAVLLVALVGPLDARVTTSFTEHMVQHLLLTMIAAPLLLLGAPITLALAAWPGSPRRKILRVLHSGPVRVVTNPIVAWALFFGFLWGIHLTGWYEAALVNPAAHAAEHAVLLGTALLFWMPIVHVDPTPSRLSHPAQILYLFLAMPAMAFLGLAIAGANDVLYPAYAQAEGVAAALADQQRAGALMWVGTMFLIVPMLAFVLLDWMRADEREASRIDARLSAAPEGGP